MYFTIEGICGSKDHKTVGCDECQKYIDNLPECDYEDYKIKCIICGKKHEFEQCEKYSQYKTIKEYYYYNSEIKNDVIKILNVGGRYDSFPCLRDFTYKNIHNEIISTKLSSIEIYFLCKKYGFVSDFDRFKLFDDIYYLIKQNLLEFIQQKIEWYESMNTISHK